FFSSRRRHTRSKRDWSSDVCSSDLSLCRDMDDQAATANTLSHLGIVAHEEGNNVRARSLFEEGLTLRRQLGDRRGIAYSLGYLEIGRASGREGGVSWVVEWRWRCNS